MLSGVSISVSVGSLLSFCLLALVGIPCCISLVFLAMMLSLFVVHHDLSVENAVLGLLDVVGLSQKRSRIHPRGTLMAIGRVSV